MDEQSVKRATPPESAVEHVDAVVIGAGFCGLYMTKHLHGMGLSLRAFDAGEDVGGVWNWNRYPGARTDSPHHTYRFTFADDLLAEWEYSQKFPPQSEVLGYLKHIADTHNLREHYTFNTRVESAVFDDGTGRWVFTTHTGEQVTSTYFVTGLGLVSEPIRPDIPGLDDFEGQVYYTTSWPHHDLDLSGKRIAVIGTGSSGIQVTPKLAEVASQLTVFQRTPNYVVPTGNRPVDDTDRAEMRENYDDVRRRVRTSPSAFPFEPSTGRLAVETPEDERERIFEQMWQRGGFSFLYESFDDLSTDAQANELACDFIRRKIRTTVQDPATAEALCPTYPYGAKRPPTGDGYYEAFNLPHVRLVDLRETPITAVSPNGISTTGAEHEFDVIVFATGFDASTGSFTRMDIRGRGSRELREHWAEGPSTYLGIAVNGYPNMFMVAGPQSPFANLPPGAEQEGGWIVDAISHMRSQGIGFMEPSEQAEKDWSQHVDDVAQQSMVMHGEGANSWFTGANIEGKPRSFNVYFGGANVYGDKLEEEAESGYQGFLKSNDLSDPQ